MSAPPDPDRLAADLLAEVARTRKLQAAPVPLLLRSPELMALEPSLRASVLASARRRGAANPKTVLALLLYGAAALALLFAAAPAQLGVLLAVGWLPAWLLHVIQLRRAAGRLARDLHEAN